MFEMRKKNFLSLLMTQLFTSKDLKRISAVSFFYSMSSNSTEATSVPEEDI